jgi:hypothetical protein
MHAFDFPIIELILISISSVLRGKNMRKLTHSELQISIVAFCIAVLGVVGPIHAANSTRLEQRKAIARQCSSHPSRYYACVLICRQVNNSPKCVDACAQLYNRPCNEITVPPPKRNGNLSHGLSSPTLQKSLGRNFRQRLHCAEQYQLGSLLTSYCPVVGRSGDA